MGENAEEDGGMSKSDNLAYEAPRCSAARSARIVQTHQGDSCLDFGEGRKGESAVLYIFAV